MQSWSWLLEYSPCSARRNRCLPQWLEKHSSSASVAVVLQTSGQARAGHLAHPMGCLTSQLCPADRSKCPRFCHALKFLGWAWSCCICEVGLRPADYLGAAYAAAASPAAQPSPCVYCGPLLCRFQTKFEGVVLNKVRTKCSLLTCGFWSSL